MFDVQQQIENEMLSNAKDVANLPLGRAGLYSASVQGDMYNQGLMSKNSQRTSTAKHI